MPPFFCILRYQLDLLLPIVLLAKGQSGGVEREGNVGSNLESIITTNKASLGAWANLHSCIFYAGFSSPRLYI